MICVSGRARNDFSRLSDDDSVDAGFLARAAIGIEDQLKKSKFLGHLPLHCLPFDFL